MVYRTCHQCFELVELSNVAHVDVFVDACWVQCVVCAAKYGSTCVVVDKDIRLRHGWQDCPYRPLELAAQRLVQQLLVVERPARP